MKILFLNHHFIDITCLPYVWMSSENMIYFPYADVGVITRFDIIRHILPLKKLGFLPGYLNLLTKKMGVVEMSTC